MVHDLLISSRRNPLVRRLRSLATRSGRDLEGVVLLEGSHLLHELTKRGLAPTEVIATDHWLDRHSVLLDELPKGTPIRRVTEEVLRAALSTVNPDGVACLCPLSCFPSPPSRAGFHLVLDRIQDPGNLGTLLRTALAADVEAVWIGAGADPLSPKVLRASAGTLFQLAHQRFGPDGEAAVHQMERKLQELAGQGIQVVATLVPEAQGVLQPFPYWDLDWTRPTALVLGTEGAGLHPRLQACCTHAVTLPHSPRVESLNVAAAAVPLLLERRRATMAPTTQQSG